MSSRDPGRAAIGTWSGGRFLHFGEAIEEDRLAALLRPGEYAAYLRMATERSLERVGADRFDLLMLHNPDLTGYGSEAVWDGMAGLRDAGLTAAIGVAPGPANGFTLDLISCL